jgi:hypothetical protein
MARIRIESWRLEKESAQSWSDGEKFGGAFRHFQH